MRVSYETALTIRTPICPRCLVMLSNTVDDETRTISWPRLCPRCGYAMMGQS